MILERVVCRFRGHYWEPERHGKSADGSWWLITRCRRCGAEERVEPVAYIENQWWRGVKA